MLFKINGSNFSTSNIGALDAYTITSVLENVESSSSSEVITKDSEYVVTFTIMENCEFDNAVITMGGTDLTDNLVWDENKKVGTLTIEQVTDNLYISIIASKISYTWYVSGMAGLSENTSTSNPSAASFAYKDAAINNACVNKPINVLRFAVGYAGVFSYGKVGEDIASTYQVLGTLQLENPSKDVVQEYMIDTVVLSEGEYMWFQGTSDVGRIYYGANNASAVSGCTGFNVYVHPSKAKPTAITGILGVDIGYRIKQ